MLLILTWAAKILDFIDDLAILAHVICLLMVGLFIFVLAEVEDSRGEE